MEKTSSVRIFQWNVPLWTLALAFVLLGLAAYFPYLNAGFSGDDYYFISMLEGDLEYNRLLGFWHGDLDGFPGFAWLWWKDPGVSGAFLRPVPSWALTLLYSAFGRDARPYHAALILVHSLAAFTAFLVLRRLVGRDSPMSNLASMAALLGALLFLISDLHGMTVGWITTITDLLSALFLNLALLCHIVARQERRYGVNALSLAFFLAALGCKETAVVYPLIVAAYEFIFSIRLGRPVYGGSSGSPEAGDRDEPADSPRDAREHRTGSRGGWADAIDHFRLFIRNAWAWGIPFILVGVYLVLYRALVPPMRNLSYIDPFVEPVRYLARALVNLPVMFVGLLTPYLPSLAVMLPESLPYAAAAGALMVALLLWALLPYRREGAVWFALLVFVIGLLPGLAADPGERILYYSSVYGLYVAAWLILQLPWLRKRLQSGAPPGVWGLGSLWGWYLLVFVLVLPLALLFVYPSMWISGMRQPTRTVEKSLPLIDPAAHHYIVYLNTDSSFNTFYLPDIYRYLRGEYKELRLLSSFNGRVWARVAPDGVAPGGALELRTEDPGWLDNMFARITRLEPELAAGDRYSNDLFSTVLMEVTEDGSDITQARFEFAIPLDDPALLLLYYDGKTYRRWGLSSEWQQLNFSVDPYGF